MTLRRVGAREANQQFSALLAAAEDNGETIVITRRGKAVARLIPEPHAQRQDLEAIDALIERYGRPMGGGKFSRDELYDRGDSVSQESRSTPISSSTHSLQMRETNIGPRARS